MTGHLKNWVTGRLFPGLRISPARPALGRRGTVAMLVGLSAPVLLITLALGIEVSGWTATKQRLQRTADAAALAAVEANAAGANTQTAATYGAYVAELNGAAGSATRNWSGNVTNILTDNQITIQKTAGLVNAGDTAFIATINATTPLYFSKIVFPGATTKALSAKATAEIVVAQTGTTGRYCVLVLDGATAAAPNAAGLNLSNAASVDVTQCGVQINTTGIDALYMTGGATLSAANVAVSSSTAPCGMAGAGTFNCGQGASLIVSGSTSTGATAGTNPYANVAIPAPGTCSATNTYFATTISPGTFCGGLNFSYGNITMNPGTYIIKGGSFAPAGGVTVSGTGVTIVMTGDATSGYATANIANGTTINISAPTSGPTKGIALLQDPLAPHGVTNNMAGGTNLNITGAMVFPSQIVNFSNGSSNATACTQLIAYQVVFAGGARFGNNCTGTGTTGIGVTTTSTPRLVK
jgi:Flp pilus assembly protein TadG